MKKSIFISLLFGSILACNKDKDGEQITIHCEGLVTDTAGTGDNGGVFMPNAFTPNNDGINELSRPFVQNIASIEFSIYDANGTEVFTTSTIGEGFSAAVPPSSFIKYYFKVQAITNAGNQIGICGEVYSLSCFPGSPPTNSFYFEDQWTPFGFTGVTAEVLDDCP